MELWSCIPPGFCRVKKHWISLVWPIKKLRHRASCSLITDTSVASQAFHLNHMSSDLALPLPIHHPPPHKLFQVEHILPETPLLFPFKSASLANLYRSNTNFPQRLACYPLKYRLSAHPYNVVSVFSFSCEMCLSSHALASNALRLQLKIKPFISLIHIPHNLLPRSWYSLT